MSLGMTIKDLFFRSTAMHKFLLAFSGLALTFALNAQRACCWTPDSAVQVSTLRDSVNRVITRFEKQILKFETEDSASLPAQGQILFVGSSSIRGWKTLREDMAPLPVIRRGFGGSTLPEIIHYAPRIIYKYRPRAIVLYGGENDMTLDYSRPEDVLISFRELDSLRNIYLPGSDLFYVSMKPSPRSWFYWPKIRMANELVEIYITEHPGSLHYIDITGTLLNEKELRPELFMKDGIHINSVAYSRWTAVIGPVLEVFWKKIH